MFEQEQQDAVRVVEEFLGQAKLKKGDLVVIGCSTSEIASHRIGSYSNADLGEAVFLAMQGAFAKEEISIATQCCEHLNRALIIEREAANKFSYEPVWVIPKPKAGGSFATAAYTHFHDPVAVEHVKARAGIDIGGTLIGMHLADVAVPVRLSINKIGQANIICARTRPKYIGGPRAVYE